MKHKKLSITWTVFLCMAGFTVLLLGVLWFFQIASLSTVYQKIKRNEVKEAAGIVISQLRSGSLQDNIDQIAEDYDISINVLEETGISIYSSENVKDSLINIYSDKQYQYYYVKAQAEGGTVLYEIDGLGYGNFYQKQDSADRTEQFHEAPGSPTGYNPRKEVTESRSVVYIKIVATEEGEEQLLLISSLITPVDATVYTLRREFVYISIIFMVVALFLGFVISKIVAKPIVKMNASAKQLAEGNFDITFEGKGYSEVHELSSTLNYAAEELGRAENLRKDLIANVSHDLRTPLTMITAYSEVMRDLPGECTPENAQVIVEESKRLTTLVNDMLDLSKLQAGVEQINWTVFDFTDNILAIMNRFAKLKEQDGFDIRFDYRDKKAKVYADEYKIYQVVYNLIINAINYAGADKAVIVRQIVNGNIVRLEVEDHGKGISEDEIQNIWDRYYKIDKTHKRAVQGTGLGLSIVKNILKLHDAKFGVRSDIGKGSVFWFELKREM